MTDTTSVHSLDAQARMFYPDGKAPWREATPPDLSAGRTMGSMRSCQFCGSMHPADLAAAIRAGARGSFADMKYGWPHKAYFDGVPNPHAGLLETRSSSSTKSEWFPHEVREPRYNERTGERIADYVTYTEAPTPAPATTHGKFYTLHLQDATPEDRDTIERHLGLRFEFDGKGVGWKPVENAPVVVDEAHPAVAAMQPLDNDGKALDLNDDTPLAPACDLSGACLRPVWRERLRGLPVNAPQVTIAGVELCIDSEVYFTALDGIIGSRIGVGASAQQGGIEHTLLTFCVLSLKNGHTVAGEAYCADPAKFNAETGRIEARKAAINKLWPMVVYAERERLAGSAA